LAPCGHKLNPKNNGNKIDPRGLPQLQQAREDTLPLGLRSLGGINVFCDCLVTIIDLSCIVIVCLVLFVIALELATSTNFSLRKTDAIN